MALSHEVYTEIAGDSGMRPYRAIKSNSAVFCVFLFSPCSVTSVYGENLGRKRKNDEHRYVKFLLTFIELIFVNSWLAEQWLNMTYQCDVV